MSYGKPVKQAAQPQQHQVTLSKTEMSVQPLHSPEMLGKYNEVHPDFAARVLQMAEKEQAERHIALRQKLELEFKIQRSTHYVLMVGQVFGLVAAFGAMGMCAYFAHLGNIQAASDAAKWVIASLAGVFITGRIWPRKGLPEKIEPPT